MNACDSRGSRESVQPRSSRASATAAHSASLMRSQAASSPYVVRYTARPHGANGLRSSMVRASPMPWSESGIARRSPCAVAELAAVLLLLLSSLLALVEDRRDNDGCAGRRDLSLVRRCRYAVMQLLTCIGAEAEPLRRLLKGRSGKGRLPTILLVNLILPERVEALVRAVCVPLNFLPWAWRWSKEERM